MRRVPRTLALAAAAGLVLAALWALLMTNIGQGELVFPPGSSFGAAIEPCPTDDCVPLFRVAEARLDRTWPAHPPVVRERLGALACSRDPHMVCAISPPIGQRDRFEVVLDLEGTPDPVLTGVICLESGVGGAVAWNGGWCIATG